MLFGKTHRCQRILRKISELFHVESRIALKCRQRAHDFRNLSVTRTNAEPSRFVPQDQQVHNELDSSLIRVLAGPCRQGLHKIGHAECLRQCEQSQRLLRLQHRNIPIIHASKFIRAHRAVIWPLYKIENERDRENRDHYHQPVPVLTQ